jgi:hypothetical protein
MVAAASLVTALWQNVQSICISCTWTVWGKAMGWSGPSFIPNTLKGKPSQAEMTNAEIATVAASPERPAIPNKTIFFFGSFGVLKSPASNYIGPVVPG